MSVPLPVLHLLPGHDRRLAHGAPWVYSNELKLDAQAKAIAPGSLVRLARVDGKPMGVASFNRNTLIAARLWTRDEAEPVDRAFLARRVAGALALRRRLYDDDFYRLVHAEGDRLPGIVVDRFGDLFVAQVNTAGAALMEEALLDVLVRDLGAAAVVLRNDSPYRKLEGLDLDVRLAYGTLPDRVVVRERGVAHAIRPLDGQKTGWYYDLRDARALFARLARGGTLLDLCCHTGAFGLGALAAGATSATFIDRSAPALDLARESARLNGLEDKAEWLAGDLFSEAERLQAAGRRFDAVAADPPSFAKSRKDVPQGLKAYRKLARLSSALVARGGFLFIASCSHNIETEAFAREVAIGLGNRPARLIAQGGAGADHPVHPQLPETEYLKWRIFQLD